MKPKIVTRAKKNKPTAEAMTSLVNLCLLKRRRQENKKDQDHRNRRDQNSNVLNMKENERDKVTQSSI
jgi:hypothetical protein